MDLTSQKHCPSYRKMASSPGFMFLFMVPYFFIYCLSDTLSVYCLHENCRIMPVRHIHPTCPHLTLKKSSSINDCFTFEANAVMRGDLTDLSLRIYQDQS